MAKNKAASLPQFESVDGLVDFFDTHDLGDYLDQMPDRLFDVDLQRKERLFALDADISDKLIEIARAKNVPTETLINAWLRAKLLEPNG